MIQTYSKTASHGLETYQTYSLCNEWRVHFNEIKLIWIQLGCNNILIIEDLQLVTLNHKKPVKYSTVILNVCQHMTGQYQKTLSFTTLNENDTTERKPFSNVESEVDVYSRCFLLFVTLKNTRRFILMHHNISERKRNMSKCIKEIKNPTSNNRISDLRSNGNDSLTSNFSNMDHCWARQRPRKMTTSRFIGKSGIHWK